MAKVRVRLPLGASRSPERIGPSAVVTRRRPGHGSFRARRQDVGKPGIPRASGARERGFNSRRPDFDCGGACVGTGRRLLSVTTQVRFLPPQPLSTEGQANWRWQPPRKRPSFTALRVRLPHLPPRAPLADWLQASVFQTEQAGSIPAGRSAGDDRGSASGRLPGLEPGDGGSTPPPRTCYETPVSR